MKIPNQQVSIKIPAPYNHGFTEPFKDTGG